MSPTGWVNSGEGEMGLGNMEEIREVGGEAGCEGNGECTGEGGELGCEIGVDSKCADGAELSEGEGEGNKSEAVSEEEEEKGKMSSQNLTSLETKTFLVSTSNTLYPFYLVGYPNKTQTFALDSNLLLL